MQLHIDTARELTGNPALAPDDLLDPAFNVDLGTRYLRRQLDRYGGDHAQAVSAYNAGTATTANQGYVSRVLAERDRFRAEEPGPVDVDIRIVATGPGGEPLPQVQDALGWAVLGLGGLALLLLLVAIVRR